MAKTRFNPDPDTDLIQHVSDSIAKAIISVPPHLALLTEPELFRKVNPSPMDYALRVSFWKEYERIMLNGSGIISGTAVCMGICTPNQFYNMLKKPERVAWLIKPKQTYAKEMEAILSRGTERLWELIELPIYNKKGEPSGEIAKIVLQAIKQVEDRVKGMAVQRSMNVNAQVVGSEAIRSIESMEQVNARIKELEGVISDSDKPGGSNGKALPAKPKEPETLELRVVSEWRSPASESADEIEEGASPEPLPAPDQDSL